MKYFKKNLVLVFLTAYNLTNFVKLSIITNTATQDSYLLTMEWTGPRGPHLEFGTASFLVWLGAALLAFFFLVESCTVGTLDKWYSNNGYNAAFWAVVVLLDFGNRSIYYPVTCQVMILYNYTFSHAIWYYPQFLFNTFLVLTYL